MLYTVTNSGLSGTNGRPTFIGSNTIVIPNGGLEQYEISDFTTDTTPQYSDPENDPLSYIKVITVPSIGLLYSNGVIVSIGDVIQSGVLTTSNFYYKAPDTGQESGYSESWQFDIADSGSNSLSGLPGGIMTMQVLEEANLPPSQIGDNTIVLQNSQSHVFTTANFTSETIPAYADPEGDAPHRLKIINLPSNGNLIFNGINVVANQIILFSEIDLGYLVYSPEISLTSAQNYNFNFSVSDFGSGEFTE
jgi:hypothetical protein